MKIISLAVLATLALTNITIYSMEKAGALGLVGLGLGLGYVGCKVFGWERNQSKKLLMEARAMKQSAFRRFKKRT